MTTTNNSSFSASGSATAAVVPPIVEASSTYSAIFPSTEAQLEIWLASKQGVEANCAYNEITSLRLEGELNLAALANAVRQLVRRHDSMRATFAADGAQMRVADKMELELETVDWSGENAEQIEAKHLQLVQQQACTPFDLENGPLFRMVLQKYSHGDYCLTIAAHHVVLDGWSLSILVRDLGHFYDSEVNPNSPSLPSAVSYQDYSAAMDKYFVSSDAQADREYWLGQFADTVPVLDLPIKGNRPALRTYFARRYDHPLTKELVGSLRKLGAKSGCSIFNTMLAAFQAFVARISGSEDFCIGIPTAGQLAMEKPDLVGHCVNTMPVRAVVDLEVSFIDQLKSTRSRMLDAFEHQRYTFGKILTEVAPPRDPSRAPMVPISFNVDPAMDRSELGFTGLNLTPIIEPRLFENFEWFINGVINDDKSIDLQIQYNTDLFTANSMAWLFRGFEEFLVQLVEDPTKRLTDYAILSVAQRQKMLVDWNQTECDFEVGHTLHGEFSKQALQTPDQVAVCFEDCELKYADLDTQSNRVAQLLIQRGIGVGDLVGICFPRNEQMLVYLLGILKSGAGYVPLDPAFPVDRLQYMCDHSGLKLVIGVRAVEALVDSFGRDSLIIEKVQQEMEVLPTTAPEIEVDANSTCYVIYTSGSTGLPKGVDVPHGAVVNFLHSMSDEPGFGAEDRVLAVTTLSFDIAVLELYLPLITGGSTVIASKEVTSDGQKIIEAIDHFGITLFQSTPASLRLMIAAGWTGQENLKILCGGEPMPRDLVAPLLERCGELWNMYGPTETTVWSSIFQITDADAPILIGKPIANTQIYILDQNLQPVPVGSDGEILIGGSGVTRGYLHQAEMTRERFVENPYYNPFAEYCNNRLYKTGDLGRFRADGNIQFLRRNDKQVKVRGFRIELGEIESAVKDVEGVQQAVAIVREDKPGDTRLVAYWVGSEQVTQTVRESLRSSLPYYMVPQHFVQLDALPQTNNGKIDYKALPVPTKQAEEDGGAEDLPQTAAQKLVANVWRNVLENEDIYLNDNFFDIGGHSLLVMKVITAIEEKTGARLAPPEFLIGTLEQLADKVEQEAEIHGGALSEEPTKLQSTMADSKKDQEQTDAQPTTVQNLEVDRTQSSGGLFNKLKGFWD